MMQMGAVLAAFTAGLYFATCQVGYFVHLEFSLSSAYVSYYAMLGAWIMGTLGGLWLERKGLGITLLGGGGLAYYMHGWLVRRYPYDMDWLPVYLGCVFVTALYSGYFFRHARSNFETAKSLFFHENNGFLLGYLIAGMELLVYGYKSQLVLPVLTSIGHLMTLALLSRAYWRPVPSLNK